MIDERVDELIRQLDVRERPNPDFVAATHELLVPLARAARASDARPLSRARRWMMLWSGAQPTWLLDRRPVAGALILLALLALALALALLLGGTHRPALPPTGMVAITVDGDVWTIDMRSGHWTLVGNRLGASDVSVSPDGKRLAFWQIRASPADRWNVMSVNERRAVAQVAANLGPRHDGCPDVWSPDSRRLAGEVIVNGWHRVVVVDIDRGTADVLTPRGVNATCPLWSPDGARLAYLHSAGDGDQTLAVMSADGTASRPVVGSGAPVGRPGTWSPDGRWIYFGGDDGSIWRVDVDRGASERLAASAEAPTSSPDGMLVSFTALPQHDLWVANADGSNARLVLANARNAGWTTDGAAIVARWMPSSPSDASLVLVTPDGSTRPLAKTGAWCPNSNQRCDMGWGGSGN